MWNKLDRVVIGLLDRLLGLFDDAGSPETSHGEESVDQYLERTPDRLLHGYALMRKKRIRHPLGWDSMTHEERLDWQEVNITKPWCACQDLRPFLIRIESQHDTEREALNATSGSENIQPFRTQDVHLMNRRLLDKEFFERQLRDVGR